MRLRARRIGAQRSTLAALAGVIFLITFLLSVVLGSLADAAESIVRSGYAEAEGDAGGLRVDIRFSGGEQDSQVRSAIAGAFDGAPLIVETSLGTDPVTIAFAGGAADLALMTPVVDPGSSITISDGQSISRFDEVLVAHAAAQEARLRPGDTVQLPGGVTATVSGLWQPQNRLDPRWIGQPIDQTMFVTDALLASTDLSPFSRWSIRPDPSLVAVADLARLEVGAGALLATLEDQVGAGSVIVAGDLPTTTASLRSAVATLLGVTPIPALLVGSIGLVAVIELVRLLIRSRTIETATVRARGAYPSRVAVDGTIETLVISVPAAALGALAASFFAAQLWLVPSIVSVGCVLVVAVQTLRDARRPLDRPAGIAEEGRSAVLIGVLTLVLVAAVIATIRFLSSSSASGGTGQPAIDHLGMLAPALVLLVGALAAAGALPWWTGWHLRAARHRALPRLLAARQVARRWVTFASPVLLISMATSGLALAVTASGTWVAAADMATQIGSGAPTRSATAELPTDSRAVPVLRAELELGDDAAQLVAIDAARVPTLVLSARGVIDTHALGAALSAPVPHVMIPDDTEELTVTANAPSELWLVDDRGRLVSQPSTEQTLPVGTGWRILAIDVSLPQGSAAFTYRIDGITADGVALALPVWRLATVSAVQNSMVSPTDGGFEVRGPVARNAVLRLLSGAAFDLPLVISQTLADRTDRGVGDQVTLRFAGSGRDLVGSVAAVVPVLPSMPTGFAVMADLTALVFTQLESSASPLATTEVWSTGPLAGVSTPTHGNSHEDAARTALLTGSIGGLLLAIAATATTAAALVRERSSEVAVLRALGLPPRQVADSRRRELVTIMGFGLITGVLIGAAASALLVPAMTRFAVPGLPANVAVPVAVDVGAGILAFVGFIALLAAIVVSTAVAVGRQARTLIVREGQ